MRVQKANCLLQVLGSDMVQPGCNSSHECCLSLGWLRSNASGKLHCARQSTDHLLGFLASLQQAMQGRLNGGKPLPDNINPFIHFCSPTSFPISNTEAHCD